MTRTEHWHLSDMTTWWPVHWSAAHPDKRVPYVLWILWHHANILPRA